MTCFCDLHTHSTASDGQYTPSELVRLAHRCGIEVMALTDHDTVEGISEASAAGAVLGMRVIPGIELSARDYDTLHILGYCFSPGAAELTALCGRVQDSRRRRNRELLAYLAEKGLPLTIEEVSSTAGGGMIGRPHFARAMLERGYVESTREAFDRYLDTEEYHTLMRRLRPSVLECMEAIHAGGGAVSLAHPYQIGLDDEALDHLVGELAEAGLDAIECLYPRHAEAMTARYLALAEKYGLHVTGGSDFHGERVKPDIALARLELVLDWLPGK